MSTVDAVSERTLTFADVEVTRVTTTMRPAQSQPNFLICNTDPTDPCRVIPPNDDFGRDDFF